MLERNPYEARKALETILGGPLRFTPIETPEGKRYRIEGVIALEVVVAVEGNQARAIQGASPAGHALYCTTKTRGQTADRRPALPAPFASIA
jgi:site-specific DNA recombinase